MTFLIKTNPRILECVTIKENGKLATSVTQKEISVFHELSFIFDHGIRSKESTLYEFSFIFYRRYLFLIKFWGKKNN